MAENFLSQEEVDALLKGVAGDADEPGAVEIDPSGIRPYDLATQERIVRGRMPTLEIINDRFARLLRIGLFNFMRRSPEITIGALRGSALFVIEPALVFLIVDNLFGGGGRFQVRSEGREFTPTEQRIIHRMLEVMLADYQKSWSSVYPLEFE